MPGGRLRRGDWTVTEAVAVVAAVICQEGRVLVGRRPAGGLSPGEWEFPGGKIQAGETPAGALARELAEELGVTARIGPQVGETRHAYSPDRVVHVVFLAAAIDGGEPAPHHHGELRWVTPEELLELDLVAGDRAFAEHLARSAGPGAAAPSGGRPRRLMYQPASRGVGRGQRGFFAATLFPHWFYSGRPGHVDEKASPLTPRRERNPAHR